MIKQELIKAVADQCKIGSGQVSDIIEATLETIRQQVKSGNDVTIRNFGTFQLRHRKEKMARNITKGTSMLIPAQDVPAFKPSRQFLS